MYMKRKGFSLADDTFLNHTQGGVFIPTNHQLLKGLVAFVDPFSDSPEPASAPT